MLSASPCPPRVLRLWFRIARHFAKRPIYVGILVVPLAVATPLAQSSIDTRQQNQMVSERAPAGAEGATGSTATFTPDLFSGALSTTVPLEIPAARRNVQPSLSLLYRSANPNGWIGVGWELELGAIERDTLPRANASELSYLFKGGGGTQQLVSVGPDEYRSKIEGAFLRINKVSGADGGPAWVVVDRTGRRYFFGTDAASRLAEPGSPLKNVFRWALDRIEDAHGNYAVVTYSRFPESTSQLYVSRVDYNGSRVSSPNLSVVFETEPRPDGLVMTRPGFVVRTTRRLSAVRVLANSALVREYVIAYRQVLAQSLLESVTQKDGSGQLSFPPTTFAYGTGGAVWPTVAGNKGPAPSVPVSGQCLIGDFTKDVGTDIACYTGSGGNWHVVKWTPAGWQTVAGQSGPAPATPVGAQCFAADFTGDGAADLACYTGSGGNWHVVQLTPNGWETIAGQGGPAPATPVGNQCVVGDFTNDGGADMACYTGSGGNWHVVKWTQSGWETIAGQNGPAPGIPVGGQCLTGRYLGTATEMACYTGSAGAWHVVRWSSNGWETLPGQNGPAPSTPVSNQCFVGDFNGDGRSDLACYTGSGGAWHVTSLTVGGWTNLAGANGPAPGSPVSGQCVVGDLSGDRADDLACYTGSSGQWHSAVWTDTGWAALQATSGPAPATPIFNQCLPGDFTADGRVDVACYTGSGGGWHVVGHTDSPPNLLTQLRTSLGATAQFAYAPSSSFENNRVPFPIQAVASIVTLDGRGGASTTTFTYRNGYYHVPEFDFRGFGSVRIDGPSSGTARVARTTFFHQGNDLVPDSQTPEVPTGFMKGKPYRLLTGDVSDTLYHETLTTYRPSDSARYFNPPSAIIQRTCERGTCGKDTKITYLYDEFGNVISERQSGDKPDSSDDRLIIRTYAANRDAWIVSALTSETIEDAIGTILSRTTFYYDDVASCDTPSSNQAPTHGDITRILYSIDATAHIESRMGYNHVGNLNCRRDPNGARTTLKYDSSNTYVREVTNGVGHTTRTFYYGIDGEPQDRGLFGQLKRAVDSNGAGTTYEFDGLGRRSLVKGPDGGLTRWAYADLGDPQQQRMITTSPAGLELVEWFDGLGRTWKSTRTAAEGRLTVTETQYDERGLIAKASLPHLDTEVAVFQSMSYDALGRMVRIDNPNGTSRGACYKDRASTFVDENGRLQRTIRTAFGQIGSVEEYWGSYENCVTLEAVPVSGEELTQYRLRAPMVTVPQSRSSYARTTFSYDGAGRLLEIADSRNHVIARTYDLLGRLKSLSDPNTGSESFEYGSDGNLRVYTNGRRQTYYYTYDLLNRLRQRDYRRAKLLDRGDVVYTYDGTAPCSIGRLIAARNDQSRIAYRYDCVGRPVRIDRTVQGRLYRVEYIHDLEGRISTIRYPGGSLIRYEYDGPSIKSVGDANRVVAAFGEYTAVGQARRTVFGNGVVTALTLSSPGNVDCTDAMARLCTVKTLGSDGVYIQDALYKYDATGNVRSIHDRRDGRLVAFAYDPLDRLVAAGEMQADKFPATLHSLPFPLLGAPEREFVGHLEGLVPSASWREFRYDELGNLRWSSERGAYTYGSTQPHAVRRAGAVGYAYEANGNTRRAGRSAYTFDREQMLRRVAGPAGVSVFAYDANGQKIAASGPGGSRVYVGALMECGPGGCARFVYANGTRIAVIQGSTTTYFHADHLGSVVAVTGANGRQIAAYTYSPYGTLTSDGAPPRFGFGGQEFDPVTGLYFFAARPYDPSLARFIGPDAFQVENGRPRLSNRYAYAQNNPVGFVDPDGRLAWFVPIIAGAVIGGIQASVNNQDVGKGMLMGAVSGAFFSVAGLASSAPWGAQLFVNAWAGAAGGVATAAMSGGDPQSAAMSGAVLGAISFGSQGIGVPGGGAGAASGVGASVAYALNSGIRGAVFGAAYASLTGGDVGQAAWVGARAGFVGAAANMAVGHGIGLLRSGGAGPTWKDGAWFYASDKNSWWAKSFGDTGRGFAFGNVISGSATSMGETLWRLEKAGSGKNSVTVYSASQDANGRLLTTWDHEMAHLEQGLTLGPYYGPAHLVSSMLFLLPHSANFLERFWITVPDY